MTRHFKGSRAIGFWTHVILGLERNQQSADPEEQKLTYLRVLKERFTGRTGKVFNLIFGEKSGAYVEHTGFENAEGMNTKRNFRAVFDQYGSYPHDMK
jgi:hypothetical protein